ncbi:MAG: transglycosylase domain-containing protein [Oleispira sp.]|nr:transglycosylase domain-containing protein [Oleispira sp.]
MIASAEFLSQMRSKLKKLASFPYIFVRRTLLFTGVIVWLGFASLIFYGYQLFQQIPSTDSISFEQARIQAQQKYLSHWVPLKKVNRDLIYAIVLSEDSHFFSHAGIDYDALIAALADNIKHREWRFGASTISQQTVKNLYLTQSKTLSRKIQEIIITGRLESKLSKNEILELYLNIIEFGPDLYGIANASQYYFNKSPKEINAAEGAYLALLMPSPRKYHYTLYQNGNWSPALSKKHRRIIRDMRFKELISNRQYENYRKWQYDKADYL